MKSQEVPREKGRAQARNRLRREILAARVTVSFNEELNRETPPTVQRLADMNLPEVDEASSSQIWNQTTESHARVRLRREISAAQVTVSLNEALNRDTPPPVKRLADMQIPR